MSGTSKILVVESSFFLYSVYMSKTNMTILLHFFNHFNPDYVVHQGPTNFSKFVIPLAAKGVEIKPTFLNLVWLTYF